MRKWSFWRITVTIQESQQFAHFEGIEELRALEVRAGTASDPDRLNDKDAHDIYRILIDISSEDLGASMLRLLADSTSTLATWDAIGYLEELFVPGPGALGATMAGRAEERVGDLETVSASVAILAADLFEIVR